jgi:hypothetical protein
VTVDEGGSTGTQEYFGPRQCQPFDLRRAAITPLAGWGRASFRGNLWMVAERVRWQAAGMVEACARFNGHRRRRDSRCCSVRS